MNNNLNQSSMVKDTFTIEDMRKAFQAGQQTVNANIGYNAFLGENGIYGTRINDGFVFQNNRNPETDHDIVKIL
jgi:hypothetical protein